MGSSGSKQHHGKEAMKVACEHRDWGHQDLVVKVKWQWMPGGTHKHHFIVVVGGHSGERARSYHWRTSDMGWSYGEDDGHTSAQLSGSFSGSVVTAAIEKATIGKRYNLRHYCCNHWTEAVTEALGQKVYCPTNGGA